MDDMGDDHKCNICNKTYSSYKTLWKHNKNKHKPNIIIDNPTIILDNHDITIKDDKKWLSFHP